MANLAARAASVTATRRPNLINALTAAGFRARYDGSEIVAETHLGVTIFVRITAPDGTSESLESDVYYNAGDVVGKSVGLIPDRFVAAVAVAAVQQLTGTPPQLPA